MKERMIGRYFQGETAEGETRGGFLSCYVDDEVNGFAMLSLPGRQGERVKVGTLRATPPPHKVSAESLTPEELARIHFKIRQATSTLRRRERVSLLELERDLDRFLLGAS